MLFGYFDFLVLGILIVINIRFFGKMNWQTGCWVVGVLFGFLLPMISMAIELKVVIATKGEWMDSFEVLYTYLRFPTYWVMGIIQCIIIGLSAKKQDN